MVTWWTMLKVNLLFFILIILEFSVPIICFICPPFVPTKFPIVICRVLHVFPMAAQNIPFFFGPVLLWTTLWRIYMHSCCLSSSKLFSNLKTQMGQAMVVPRCSLKWTLAEKENWIGNKIKMQMLLLQKLLSQDVFFGKPPLCLGSNWSSLSTQQQKV